MVNELEAVTNNDEIMAQFFLQENGWDLSRALNIFSSNCEKAESSSSQATLVTDPNV